LDSTISAIEAALKNANEILVISHVAPDGDSVSSLSAAGLALHQLGKSATLVSDDGIPERFHFLPLSNQIKRTPTRKVHYDLIVALDCGDEDRLGEAFACLSLPIPPIVNIDHHVTNTNFGQINLVQADANSTTEILFGLFSQLGIQMTQALAISLLTGLVTDTLSFRTSRVTASTLQTAGTLVEAGADLFTVTSQALNRKPLSTLLIWQKGLNNMKVEDGLIWTCINNSERIETGHDGSSSFGLGNMMANAYQASMSAVLLELADGRVSIGFRCNPPFSVAELASDLGGGGHPLASGCTLSGPLDKAEILVVNKSKETIRKLRLSQ